MYCKPKGTSYLQAACPWHCVKEQSDQVFWCQPPQDRCKYTQNEHNSEYSYIPLKCAQDSSCHSHDHIWEYCCIELYSFWVYLHLSCGGRHPNACSLHSTMSNSLVTWRDPCYVTSYCFERTVAKLSHQQRINPKLLIGQQYLFKHGCLHVYPISNSEHRSTNRTCSTWLHAWVVYSFSQFPFCSLYSLGSNTPLWTT